MRKLILVCLTIGLFYAQTVFASGIMSFPGGGVPAAGTWYYTTAETDSGYTTGGLYISITALLRALIPVTTGGSLTKVAFKLNLYSAGVTAVICQVYKADKTLISGANGTTTITNNPGIWFEMTLATPYTVASSESVFVALGATGNGGSKVGYAASGADDRYAVTWGSPPTFPDPITDGTINYADLGIKVYVQ